jgi:HK97 family phage major capsid protein
MSYTFKNITLPEDHGFGDEQLKFLQTIDEAMVKSQEQVSNKEDIETIKTDLEAQMKSLKTDFNYDKLQEQINGMFIKFNELSASPLGMTKEQTEKKERDLTSKWIRAFVKKDKAQIIAVETELKTMSPIMHLGPATGSGPSDLAVDYTQGGYLVPQLLLAEVNRFVEEGGVARREMRYLPFAGAGNSRYIPTLMTDVTVSWVDEGEAKPKTKPYIGRVEQVLNKLAAIVILTEEIVEDAVINLVSLCGQLIGEAIAAEEDNQFFSGTGAPWTGIINTAGVVSMALSPGEGPLNIRPEALLALTVAIPSGAVAGAKFYMNRQVWAAISARRSDAVAASDSRGNYLVQTPGQSSPGSVWGFPVVLVESLPSIGDIYGVTDVIDYSLVPSADEPFLFFGNLQKTCVYGDKQGLRVKMLDQASLYDTNGTLINLAEKDMIALRVHKRVGFVAVLPAGIAVLSTGATS